MGKKDKDYKKEAKREQKEGEYSMKEQRAKNIDEGRSMILLEKGRELNKKALDKKGKK